MIFWTIAILAVYLVVIFAVGIYSSRGAGRDAESFFVANRQLSWLQESMSVFTTMIPAAALVGTIGLFYSGGANMLGYLISYAFLLPLTYWYIGSRLRRLGRLKGYQTQAAFIGVFYQSAYLRWAVAIAGIVFSVPIILSQVVTLGYLLNHYTGLPYGAAVLIFVAVSVGYTLKGGLRAVANTDVLHGVLLLLFLIGAIIVIVGHAGGIVNVLNTPKATVSGAGPGMQIFFAWTFYVGLATCVQPDRAFRMYAVRDEKNFRRGVVIGGAMTTVCSLSFLLIALAVNTIAPGLKHTDTALVTGLGLAAPWLIPWFVMNAWGGGMSSFTAGMLSVTNIFIKDIFEPWHASRGKSVSLEQRNKITINASRLFILALAVLSLLVSAYPLPFIWALINITVGGLLQFLPMFLFGFLWRGFTCNGAIAGWTLGVITMCLWSFVLKPPLGPLAGVDALLVNIVVSLAVSRLLPESTAIRQARDALRALAVSDVDSLPTAAFVPAAPLQAAAAE
jgi:Na+/proline symporter